MASKAVQAHEASKKQQDSEHSSEFDPLTSQQHPQTAPEITRQFSQQLYEALHKQLSSAAQSTTHVLREAEQITKKVEQQQKVEELESGSPSRQPKRQKIMDEAKTKPTSIAEDSSSISTSKDEHLDHEAEADEANEEEEEEVTMSVCGIMKPISEITDEDPDSMTPEERVAYYQYLKNNHLVLDIY